VSVLHSDALPIGASSKVGWGPEDVEGKLCTVVLEVAEDAQGVEKNRVVKVKPSKTQSEPKSPHSE
jgi:predicted thioesterase